MHNCHVHVIAIVSLDIYDLDSIYKVCAGV